MIDKTDIITIISKSAAIGTGIVFGVNIGCLGVGHILTRDTEPTTGIGIITLIFIVIAAIDFLVGFVLKYKLLSPLFDQTRTIELDELKQTSTKVAIITAAVCAAMPIYGLAAVVIEGNIDVLVGFAIASLAGFMFMRLRPKIEEHVSGLE